MNTNKEAQMQTIPSLDLSSFANELNVLIVGAGGGIGSAMVEGLLGHQQVARVYGAARKPLAITHAKLTALQLDLQDEASVAPPWRRSKCRWI